MYWSFGVVTIAGTLSEDYTNKYISGHTKYGL
jgi:hypothetical protein